MGRVATDRFEVAGAAHHGLRSLAGRALLVRPLEQVHGDIRSTVKPREKSREEASKDSTDDASEKTDLKNDADTTPDKG